MTLPQVDERRHIVKFFVNYMTFHCFTFQMTKTPNGKGDLAPPSTQLPSSTQHEDLAIWKQHRTIPKERVKAADKMDEHRAWESVATTGTI